MGGRIIVTDGPVVGCRENFPVLGREYCSYRNFTDLSSFFGLQQGQLHVMGMVTNHDILENGFHFFMGKEAVLGVRLETLTTVNATFTDLYRKKFGVNHEIFI